MKSLLLGCGHDRRKKLYLGNDSEWKGELVALDMGPDCNPDIVWDLENRPLPFDDEEFDEIAAYDVLEHVGRQGDWRGFFDEFSEYHRILKPRGTFGMILPIGADALADPGHTRFFHKTQFGFLNQRFYADNLKAGNPVTDYRWHYKKNFEIDYIQEIEGHHLAVIIRKA